MNLLDLMIKVGIDDQASSKLGKISGNIKSGLAGAAKAGAVAIGAGVAAASAGVAAMSKQALDAYASYEQLSGGISKLFGDAGGAVMQNAQKAFMTTGQTANEYMEQVSGFSAALVNSLGGDVTAAADRADVAMRAISDNVNTFGTDAESVSKAFQGFAKQNYTMLDNLKLGYGGTKTEMERLIADANEYAAANGQAANLTIDSFADIVTAIDLIQQKQNIAGTTAKEAATTIEGSIRMTQAAWGNFLSELGKSDGDVGARFKELMDSASTALLGATDENGEKVSEGIVGRVKQIVSSIAEYLPQAVPQIIEAGKALFGAIGEAVLLVAPSILESVKQALVTAAQAIAENKDAISNGAVEAFIGLVEAIADIAPIVLESLLQLLVSLVAAIIDHAPQLLAAAGNLILSLVEGIANGIGPVMTAMNDLIQSGLDAVGEFFGSMFDAGVNLVMGLIDGIGSVIGGVGDAIMGGLNDAVGGVLSFLGIASPSKLFKWVGDMTMQGLAEGIERTASEAQNAMTDAAKGLYASAEIGASSQTVQNGAIMDGINSLSGQLGNIGIYLDGKVLVGYLAPGMDRALVVA